MFYLVNYKIITNHSRRSQSRVETMQKAWASLWWKNVFCGIKLLHSTLKTKTKLNLKERQMAEHLSHTFTVLSFMNKVQFLWKVFPGFLSKPPKLKFWEKHCHHSHKNLQQKQTACPQIFHINSYLWSATNIANFVFLSNQPFEISGPWFTNTVLLEEPQVDPSNKEKFWEISVKGFS